MKNAILRKKIEELKSDIKALITGSFLERSLVEMKWKYVFDIDKCFDYFHTITIKPKAPFKMRGIYPLMAEQQTNEPSKPAETENYKWTESLINKLALFVLETSDSEKYKTLEEVISVFKKNNPSPAEEKVDFSVAKAVDILTTALNADPDFRETYKANIAMMFWDEFNKVSPLSGYRSTEIHEIANKAADRFLNHWCQTDKKSPVEEKGYATSKLKEFVDGLKKLEPLPYQKDFINAGWIHLEPPPFVFGSLFEAGSVGFDHSTGKVFFGTSDEEAKKRSEEKKKEEPKKYPEGILSFKKADGTFGYHIEKLTIIPYQEWCEYHLESKPVATIHQVKNNNGEVFTVGDEVCHIFQSPSILQGKIISFRIHKDAAILAEFISAPSLGIKSLTKVEKPKSATKYPEGILSFITPDGKISHYCPADVYQKWCACYLMPMTASKIDAVSNSKGEVFKLGDTYKPSLALPNEPTYRIDSFEIVGQYIHVISGKLRANIDYITKAVKKGLAFMSWDGYEIFIGDNYFLVQNDWSIIEVQSTACTTPIVPERRFKRKVKAQEYVSANQPKKEPLFTSKDGYPVYEGEQYHEIHSDGSGYFDQKALSPVEYYLNNSAIRFRLVTNAEKYVTEKKGILKTDDGFTFNIFTDKVWTVNKNSMIIGFRHVYCTIAEYEMRFKEEKNAIQYVADHKKSISWSELEEFILRATWNQKINTGRDFLMIYYEDFINRFKPKK